MSEGPRRRTGARWRLSRKTPSVLQLEAAECGAASLAMILGHYGRHVPLETLRAACGVSRDGSKASSIVKAARSYGLESKGLKAEPEHLADLPMPLIAFVDFCHFLVVEGLTRNHVWLNDPASGRRKVSRAEFDEMFTGVVLTFAPGEDFARGDERPALFSSLVARTRGVRLAVLFILMASLAMVIPGLAIPVFSRVFVDYVLVASLEDWLKPILIGIAIAALARYLLVELQNYFLTRAETRLAVDGARQLLTHILRLPIAFFGTRFSGEIAGRLNLSDGLAALLTGQVAQVVLNLFMALFFFALMLAYSVKVALVVAVLSFLNVIAVLYASRALVNGYRKLSIDSGKLGGVSISGIRDIETYKAAGAEDSFFARWAGLHANMVSTQQAIDARLAPLGAVPQLLVTLTMASVLVLGGYEVMNGALTIGMLVALQSLSASFTGPVVALTGLTARFQEVRSFTERIEDVQSYPADPLCATGRPETLDMLPKGEIELQGISFGYLPLEAPLIEDFSLTLKPGGSIALVGASGSGKSTLGRIIAGLYAPSQGRILIDGRPVLDWPRPALASAVTYVDQDIVLFEGSVRENLTLWDATVPEADVIRAAHDALIHDVIAARAGTYDSPVTEGGGNFSGGQRQRLEIARALVTDPRIVILDEATSALDTVSEAQVMENIRARGASLIIIAHRLSTIRDCDEIIVLEHGKPVERGTHAQLMARRGRYAGLIEA